MFTSSVTVLTFDSSSEPWVTAPRPLLFGVPTCGAPQVGTPNSNGLGAVTQGSLEESNVNTVTELVNMIECQRAYEMNSKAISTTDQMLQYLTTNLS